MTAGVLVFVDLPGGELDDVGKGILAEGQRLAATLGTTFGAACFSGAPDGAFDAFRPYGVPEILEIQGEAGIADRPVALAEALSAAAVRVGAKVVLLAHTDLGSMLAPVIAARLSAAIFTEAVSYSRDWAGLTVRRHAVGAQVADQRIWTDAAPGNGSSVYGKREAVTPLVLTILQRVLSPVVLSSMRPGEARRTPWEAPAGGSGHLLRVIERVPPDPETMDVVEAPVVFTAGLGCDRASFDVLCELAAVVGASVGVTRPVYDLGWKGFERMIGQTGKTVVPRLYLTFGISGSMHHVGGITDSKRIVCVNVDPKAPIFPNADEGFVADVREVLPMLLERVRALNEAPSSRRAVAGGSRTT
jgi:electron transfer flavoprotein alpha subunit